MPNLEHEMAKLAGAEYFATFDLSHGYWRLPLSSDTQECQFFITPDGLFTPTRVLHGTANAVTHLQSPFPSIIPEELKENVLSWLDDILILLRLWTNYCSTCQKFSTFVRSTTSNFIQPSLYYLFYGNPLVQKTSIFTWPTLRPPKTGWCTVYAASDDGSALATVYLRPSVGKAGSAQLYWNSCAASRFHGEDLLGYWKTYETSSLEN